MDQLDEANIESRPIWKPLHMQPLFEGCKFYPHAEDDVVSERLFVTGICLPSDSKMTLEEQQKVIDLIVKAL